MTSQSNQPPIVRAEKRKADDVPLDGARKRVRDEAFESAPAAMITATENESVVNSPQAEPVVDHAQDVSNIVSARDNLTRDNILRSPLLRLPGELRNLIYEYVLGGNIILPKESDYDKECNIGYNDKRDDEGGYEGSYEGPYEGSYEGPYEGGDGSDEKVEEVKNPQEPSMAYHLPIREFDTEKQPTHQLLALTYVCRQIHAETRCLLYSSNIFWIRRSSKACITNLFTSEHCRHITTVAVGGSEAYTIMQSSGELYEGKCWLRVAPQVPWLHRLIGLKRVSMPRYIIRAFMEGRKNVRGNDLRAALDPTDETERLVEVDGEDVMNEFYCPDRRGYVVVRGYHQEYLDRTRNGQ